VASIKDVQQLTQGLEDLVGQLNSELQNGEVDFDKLVSITDELSERADGLAETFSSVNDALMQRLQSAKQGSSGGSRQQASRSAAKAGSRS
jgi:capsule polysaccharide export protein KpsE/RkpR